MNDQQILENLKEILNFYTEETIRFQKQLEETTAVVYGHLELCINLREEIKEIERSNERILYLCRTGKEYPLMTIGYYYV